MITKFQILLTALFIAAGTLQALGANKLSKLVQEIYPDISVNGFRPQRRILKKIEIEKKDDKEILKRLRTGRVFEIAALVTFVLFLVVFLFGLNK